jgi:hypothetical protein
MECGLRVVHGEQAGLGQRWTHGVAQVQPRIVTFTPFIGGMRVLRRPPIEIAVREIDSQRERMSPASEMLSARPGPAVIQLVTATGAVIDWLVHPDLVQWADLQLSAT